MSSLYYLEQVNHFERLHHNSCKPRHIHLHFWVHMQPCHQLAYARTWSNTSLNHKSVYVMHQKIQNNLAHKHQNKPYWVFFKLLPPPFFINLLKYVFKSVINSSCKSSPIATNKKKGYLNEREVLHTKATIENMNQQRYSNNHLPSYFLRIVFLVLK